MLPVKADDCKDLVVFEEAAMQTLEIFVIAIRLLSHCGCVSPSPTSVSQQAPVSEIIDAMRESHPEGIPLRVAQKTMEQNGFICRVVRDGTFVHQVRDSESSHVDHREISGMDFIECRRETQNGMVTSFDTVALELKNDTVVDVLSNWEAIGP
jgi:hypothetical protein